MMISSCSESGSLSMEFKLPLEFPVVDEDDAANALGLFGSRSVKILE